jgi:hypothetical protein
MLLKNAIRVSLPQVREGKRMPHRGCHHRPAITNALGDDAVVAGEMLADECVAAWQLRPN